jgi:hypothetical protein
MQAETSKADADSALSSISTLSTPDFTATEKLCGIAHARAKCERENWRWSM